MAETALYRVELCRDILHLRGQLERVPFDKAASAKIAVDKRIRSIRKVLLGRPGRTLVDDLMAPSVGMNALAQHIKQAVDLPPDQQNEALAYVGGLLKMHATINNQEMQAGVFKNHAVALDDEAWATIKAIQPSATTDALVDNAIALGSIGANRREELAAALAESGDMQSRIDALTLEDVDPVLYRKIQDLKAAWNQGSLRLRSLEDSAHEAVRAAIRSRDPHEKEAYTQEAERMKAEYTAEAKRINAIIDTLNKDKTLARKLLHEGREKLQSSLSEVGQRVIGEMMAASNITEKQASDWAKSQSITPQARARFKKLGYPVEQVLQDMADFYRITGGRLNAVKVDSKGDKRANATGIEDHGQVGAINIGTAFDKRVLWHELAHHLEADPAMKQAAGQLIERRSVDGKAYTLRSLTGDKGYHSSEVAYKDSFFSEYVGKIYHDGVTEVFSMGVESLSNPLLLARRLAKDPETLEFVMGMLKRPMGALAVAHKELSGRLLETSMEINGAKKNTVAELQAMLADKASPIDNDTDMSWTEDDIEFEYFKRYKLTQIGQSDGMVVFSGKVKNRKTNRQIAGFVLAPKVLGGFFQKKEYTSMDMVRTALGYFAVNGILPYQWQLEDEKKLRMALGL